MVKEAKSQTCSTPPPLSPPFEPIEVPARKSQSKMRVSNSEAETEEIPREKAGLPSSEKRIRKKEKFVKDAWSCLAGDLCLLYTVAYFDFQNPLQAS